MSICLGLHAALRKSVLSHEAGPSAPVAKLSLKIYIPAVSQQSESDNCWAG